MSQMSQFEISTKGVVIKNGRILLFRLKKARWWYYPGGHIEFRERAEDALKREIREELGLGIQTIRYMGLIENVFFMQRTWHHSLELAFSISLDGEPRTALEPHEECEWVSLTRFRTMNVLPRALRKEILKWLRTKKTFWGSDIRSHR